MAKKKAETKAAPVEETQEQAQPQPELSIQDLMAVRNIIDVASQRGAFKAAEMEPVGRAYNKLNSFLEAVTPQAEPQAEEAAAEE